MCADHPARLCPCCFGIHLLCHGIPFPLDAVSSLKTKEEVLDTASFLPSVPQFGNYRSIPADSPIPGYLANSFFVSLAAAAIQLVCCALFTYAVTFMKIRGRDMLFRLVLFTYMVPTAVTYHPMLYHIIPGWGF